MSRHLPPRTAATVILLAALLLPALRTPNAGAATGAWRILPRPWTSAIALIDVTAFPPAGVALAGGGGRVALSVNGGATWAQRGVGARGVRGVKALDFTSASRGVLVGNGGLLLVTSDGGRSWKRPVITGGTPTSGLLAVDMAGATGYAGGRAGALLVTTDGGSTWTLVPPVTADDITAVAAGAGGAGIAGTAQGDVLLGSGTTWRLAGTAPAAVLDAAATGAALAGQWPALMVTAGASLLGTIDGATLDWSLDGGGATWQSLASLGTPYGALLLAGPGGAVDSIDQLSVPTAASKEAGAGGADAVRAAAPGGQSVAYLLGADGSLRRTLSAARRPPATLPDPPAGVVTAGTAVTFGPAPVDVAAPGTLLLESRVAGGAWTTSRKLAWSAADWGGSANFTISPTLTAVYRLRFRYGATMSLVAAATTPLAVSPTLTPDRPSYNLLRGAIYRFAGSVFPALSGERVTLWTDRGGAWHLITLGGGVRLSAAGRWSSRRFGTPLRETYDLQARIAATARHAAARSPVVTVTIN